MKVGYTASHVENSLNYWLMLRTISVLGRVIRKVEYWQCVFKECTNKLFENEYSMLVHYYEMHKAYDQNPIYLLERSKEAFEIIVPKMKLHKDVEENPKVVYLDPELQLIIDYKDSLIEIDEFYEYKKKLANTLQQTSRRSQNRVSKRNCGNLTVSKPDKSILNISGNDKLIQSARNFSETRVTSETKLNKRPILSNLNRKDDSLSNSDSDENSLNKRNIDLSPVVGRKGSIDADDLNKRIKRDGRHLADKRISRRCTNLA